MEQPQSSTINNARQSAPQSHTKQIWHRPTFIFVPLKTTALSKGSFSDGGLDTLTNTKD